MIEAMKKTQEERKPQPTDKVKVTFAKKCRKIAVGETRIVSLDTQKNLKKKGYIK